MKSTKTANEFVPIHRNSLNINGNTNTNITITNSTQMLNYQETVEKIIIKIFLKRS